MGIELSGAGEALTAIVVSNEVSNHGGGNTGDQSDSHAHNNCANCGTQLTGAYCHACGQSSHIHRSLLHMVEEVLHGIFHFDTKAWRTLPALIFKPGHLTKQYIEGKRTSFVSPLALFLFLIFLMFFVFSYTMNGPSNDMLNIPDTREDVVKELSRTQAALTQQLAEQVKQGPHGSEALDLREEISDSQFEIRKLQDALNKFDGKERDISALTQEFANAEKNLDALRNTEREQKLAQKLAKKTQASAATEASSEPNLETTDRSAAGSQATSSDSSSSTVAEKKLAPEELKQSIRIAEREVKYLKKQLVADKKNEEKGLLKQNIKTQFKDSDGANINFNDASYFPYVGEAIEHATKNPELTLYKMKKNASGLAFLLMPITLPFLWLLFAFKRKYVMFDHAVFSLYSLSFMCILLTIVAILAKFDFKGTATFLFLLAPPIHMYAQLKHAYSLSRLETLWRTLALLFIALISLTVYASLVTLLSA
ncbi:DUF3667 domain-containing protein [Undibacterium sp. Di24W]|uniref:DUF3667 domain-containing protein n=1 Tax=Undibacterium sp. Di24W TaxID=3413033 RepID=UPI003BF229AE